MDTWTHEAAKCLLNSKMDSWHKLWEKMYGISNPSLCFLLTTAAVVTSPPVYAGRGGAEGGHGGERLWTTTSKPPLRWSPHHRNGGHLTTGTVVTSPPERWSTHHRKSRLWMSLKGPGYVVLCLSIWYHHTITMHIAYSFLKLLFWLFLPLLIGWK